MNSRPVFRCYSPGKRPSPSAPWGDEQIELLSFLDLAPCRVIGQCRKVLRPLVSLEPCDGFMR